MPLRALMFRQQNGIIATTLRRLMSELACPQRRCAFRRHCDDFRELRRLSRLSVSGEGQKDAQEKSSLARPSAPPHLSLTLLLAPSDTAPFQPPLCRPSSDIPSDEPPPTPPPLMTLLRRPSGGLLSRPPLCPSDDPPSDDPPPTRPVSKN